MSSQRDVVQEIIARYPPTAASLIMVLQDIQEALRHVPAEAVDAVATGLGVPRSRVWSALSFYRAFSLAPRGRHQVDVCTGTACHVRGAGRLVEQLSDELGIAPGGTTADGEVSLDTVHCVGACALGPVVLMDGECHGEKRNEPHKFSTCNKHDSTSSITEADVDMVEPVWLPVRPNPLSGTTLPG